MALHFTLYLLIVATAVAAVEASHQYKVGDDGGWRVPGDGDPELFKVWASKIRFQVGDSIVFQYQNDSVVRVEKRGYYHCNESSRGEVFKDGNTLFLLDKPGFYYFVSGDLEHCKKGQRLVIEVPGASPLVPGGPSPSPMPSMAVPCDVPSLSTAFAVLTWCLALGFNSLLYSLF